MRVGLFLYGEGEGMMQNSTGLNAFDVQILAVVAELERRQYKLILPKFVQPRLSARISERQVRRYMARLAEWGFLFRPSPRKGYVLQ